MCMFWQPHPPLQSGVHCWEYIDIQFGSLQQLASDTVCPVSAYGFQPSQFLASGDMSPWSCGPVSLIVLHTQVSITLQVLTFRETLMPWVDFIRFLTRKNYEIHYKELLPFHIYSFIIPIPKCWCPYLGTQCFCVCCKVFFTSIALSCFLLTFQIIRIMKIVLLNIWTGAPPH